MTATAAPRPPAPTHPPPPPPPTTLAESSTQSAGTSKACAAEEGEVYVAAPHAPYSIEEPQEAVGGAVGEALPVAVALSVAGAEKLGS